MNTNSRPAKIALIGSGVIGQRHLQAIEQSSAVTLVGIADPQAAAQAIAREHDVPCYTDNDALLAQTEPDGVIVATPTEHHLKPTLAALDAGVHVLVEKPIMATLDEAEQVVARSAARQRHVLVGHHRRYYEQVDRAREMIEAGVLGQLVAVSGQWNMRKHDAYYEPDWRKGWKAGPVLTNLIHEIDSLRYICGAVVSVSAETANSVQGFEKEDVAALVFRFASGALGSFILSDQSNSPWSWECATGENAAFPPTGQNAVRFMGTDGSLEFPNLVLWRHDPAPGDWTQPIAQEVIECGMADAYINQIEHFGRVTLGQQAPRITAADATDTLRVINAVFESAKSGRRITL